LLPRVYINGQRYSEGSWVASVLFRGCPLSLYGRTKLGVGALLVTILNGDLRGISAFEIDSVLPQL